MKLSLQIVLVVCASLLLSQRCLAKAEKKSGATAALEIDRVLDRFYTGKASGEAQGQLHRLVEEHPAAVMAAVGARQYSAGVLELLSSYPEVLRDHQARLVPLFIKVLHGRDVTAQRQVLELIGEAELARSCEPLAEVIIAILLPPKGSRAVRIVEADTALRDIGVFFPKKVVPLLLKVVREGAMPQRLAAIDILGALGSGADFAAGDLAAMAGEQPALATKIIAALGSIGHRSDAVVAALKGALKSENEAVRYAAAQSLALVAPQEKECAGALLPFLEAEHPTRLYFARKEVLEAIAGLPLKGDDAKVVLDKVRPLINDPVLEVRAAAARLVLRQKPGDAASIQILARVLAFDARRMQVLHKRVALESLAALGRIGAAAKPAVHRIQYHTEKTYNPLYFAAALAMSRIYPQQHESPMEEMEAALKSNKPGYPQIIYLAAQFPEDCKALRPHLLKKLAVEDTSIVEGAAKALLAIGKYSPAMMAAVDKAISSATCADSYRALADCRKRLGALPKATDAELGFVGGKAK